ncbi:hypothetical protein FQA39_LY09025 [Lamprigera yunnana]|nr:hypothetical protein FQA39_LY09025 [Lamprigera yunnana]
MLTILIGLIWWKLNNINTYWIKRNIVQYNPRLFFGNYGPLILQQKSLSDLMDTIYKHFENVRYYGIYQFVTPNLVIKDLDLIKRITIKDFDTFPEHRTVLDENIEPLVARNILFMKGGDKWQKLRSMVSPTFTSSKLKMMYPLMVKCAQQMLDHYENKGDDITLEMKDAFSRYTNDVIGTTAFGIECNSLEEPNNIFYRMGNKTMNMTFFQILAMFMYNISPFIAKVYFKLTLVPQDVGHFFRKTVIDAMRVRQEKGIFRPDMIHLLMEARKGRIKYDEDENKLDSSFAIVQESEIGKSANFKFSDISDDDLVAQALIFFLAGYDTSSTAISFGAYELAINPDVQQKLIEEIDEVLSAKKGEFVSYEELIGMKYLDCVVSEILRKWPPIVISDRRAVKSFTVEPELPGETRIHFDAGTTCIIPTYSIHRDPKYYPNPEKFDPDRFSDDNKHLLVPFSYLPFGLGPKSCIGSRFALLEAKLIIFAILSKYRILPVPKTSIPLTIKRKGLFLAAEGGIWLGLEKRTD